MLVEAIKCKFKALKGSLIEVLKVSIKGPQRLLKHSLKSFKANYGLKYPFIA
jgi:hypothetical protein